MKSEWQVDKGAPACVCVCGCGCGAQVPKESNHVQPEHGVLHAIFAFILSKCACVFLLTPGSAGTAC